MPVIKATGVSIRYITGDFKDIGLKEYITRKLTKNFVVHEFWANRNITFELEKGDMLGIVGSNGAGKSTLLKAISGIMVPTKGHIQVQGNIAALLELTSGFDGDLTVRENTYLRGALLGYTRKFMDEMYDQIISFAELEDFQDRPFKHLSSGMKSRLAFSIACLVRPDILILDEPTSGLDPIMQQNFIDFILSEKKRGKTILLSSHIFHEVDACCDRISIIKDGRIVADFVADELKNRSTKIYRISFSDKDSYDAFVCKDYLFHSRNEKKLRARVMIEAAQINQLLTNITPLSVTEFQEIPFTLEDYFMEFYKNDCQFGEVQS